MTSGWRSSRLLWVAVVSVVAVVAFAIDVPLQRAVSTGRPPSVVQDYFNAAETFGNGFGVVMVVLAVVVLDASRRVQTSRLIAASLGAGIVADLVKLGVSRSRPHSISLEQVTAWDTFSGWAPLLSAGSQGQSFPSAHTACAFGLAAALAYAYPGGARMFYSFAAGVALQRVCMGAHFLSDVVIGAALGVVWAGAVCQQGMLCAGFDRMEAWWSRRFGWSLPEGHNTLAEEADTLPMHLGSRDTLSPSTETQRAA